jgi:hypothetical protein
VIARCVTLLSVHAAFTITIYLSIYYSYTNPVLYGTLIWVALADNIEILALITDPQDGIQRPDACPLLIWETMGLGLFLIAYLKRSNPDGLPLVASTNYMLQEEEIRIMNSFSTRLWQVVLLSV